MYVFNNQGGEYFKRKNIDTVPNYNPRIRYGKGKYKNTLKNDCPKNNRANKGRPKSGPQRKKCKTNKRPTDTRGWGSIHQWITLLESDFSSHFYLNCTQYIHYLDAVINKIDHFDDATDHHNIF